ncbi:MAG: glutamine--tRNA ligase/YqeY domain fusion protein [Bacteroidota bacterium]
MSEVEEKSLNFIEQIVEKDLAEGVHTTVQTRFPPHPNGYLHIGHAKAICVNFTLAQKYGGQTNLRFDDTNPSKESQEYIDAIKRDVNWLGFQWEGEPKYASDYFGKLYEFAQRLIQMGLAYIDQSSLEEIREMRGTVTEAGKNSPYRDRPTEESLKLLEEMKNGVHDEGSMVCRAKIDMAHSNINMRDPLMYRILKVPHNRTGNEWNIYPLYDFTHGISDSLENVTHSLCSLEFDIRRPLYDWFLEKLALFPSRQYEFARLNLSHTVVSKTKLSRLISEDIVDGWDDPRMPTLSGLKRRGYTPEAIRNFCDRIGVAKINNVIDVSLLEFSIKDHLNKIAPRVFAVLDPIKLIITNYPEGQEEDLLIENNPEDENAGSREVKFGREVYIERGDFMEDAPKKYFRLSPGRNVRLKGAYILHCEKGVYHEQGDLKEVHCTYYENSKSGQDESGIKAKGTLHWVACNHAHNAEIRLYDRLFNDESPDGHKEKDFMDFINPESLNRLENCKVEASLMNAEKGEKFQFQRIGYFCADEKLHSKDQLVFNRTVPLRDSWAKQQKKGG